MKKLLTAGCLLLFALFGCRKPYNPPAITNNNNFLVVEGIINAGQDSTIIKLSRTVQLSSESVNNPELHATVTVLSDANVGYALTETGNGNYAAAGLNLNAANKYCLKIVSSNGKVYQSDFLPVKNSPPIDSVYYVIKSDGVQINLTTHDPANKTTYYRWSYNETYIIHPDSESYVVLKTTPFDTVVARTDTNQVYTCWRTDTASSIMLGSTARLSQDVIEQNQMTLIPYNSEKIAFRYSILVKQYALSPDAFNYYTQLKKNTEQLGSIFDAQPTQLPSNIHCITTPSEPVIGYLSVGANAEKRIFIDNRPLPTTRYQPVLSVDGCFIGVYYFKRKIGFDTYVNDIPIWIYSGKQFPLTVIQPRGSPILGYLATDQICADCTLRGTNKRPSFWKD